MDNVMKQIREDACMNELNKLAFGHGIPSDKMQKLVEASDEYKKNMGEFKKKYPAYNKILNTSSGIGAASGLALTLPTLLLKGKFFPVGTAVLTGAGAAGGYGIGRLIDRLKYPGASKEFKLMKAQDKLNVKKIGL